MIYKILTPAAWAAMRESGVLARAGVDAADGFVHFSTAAQLDDTLDKHYAGHDDLVILAVNADKFGASIKWEVSRGGDLFPHLYTALRDTDVEAVFTLTPTRAGLADWMSQMAGAA